MPDIMLILSCLSQSVDKTSLGRLGCVVEGLLAMTGRVTMRGIDYYRLRFQIEFNFRDAKQYWGLEDFMVIKPTPVYNSANLAMLMINLSQILMRPVREHCPSFSVNDLKAHFRGRQ
jgi:hypothetical protein